MRKCRGLGPVLPVSCTKASSGHPISHLINVKASQGVPSAPGIGQDAMGPELETQLQTGQDGCWRLAVLTSKVASGHTTSSTTLQCTCSGLHALNLRWCCEAGYSTKDGSAELSLHFARLKCILDTGGWTPGHAKVPFSLGTSKRPSNRTTSTSVPRAHHKQVRKRQAAVVMAGLRELQVGPGA